MLGKGTRRDAIHQRARVSDIDFVTWMERAKLKCNSGKASYRRRIALRAYGFFDTAM